MPMIKAKPAWLRKRLCAGAMTSFVSQCLNGLHTVCESARCPNKAECFGKGSATFMILGNVCTRNCLFCAVKKGTPLPPDTSEPQRLARAVALIGLRYIVITSVTRDDLPDGGLSQFEQTLDAIRTLLPEATVEILTPDFAGVPDAVGRIAAMSPDVFNHNVETVPRLYTKIRRGADWERSLRLLRGVKHEGIITKSGIMLGLGETEEEIRQAMKELKDAGVSILTLGQYLQPAMENCEVVEYITPEKFEYYRIKALETGFAFAASGPFVRSSYNAEKIYKETVHIITMT